MLFDKNVRKICAFCEHSTDFDTDTVLCAIRGPVSPDYHCRKYEYDPLRRKPAPPPELRVSVSPDSFKL